MDCPTCGSTHADTNDIAVAVALRFKRAVFERVESRVTVVRVALSIEREYEGSGFRYAVAAELARQTSGEHDTVQRFLELCRQYGSNA
jgi:hypothetical protein